jgi:hypothetical protein
MSARVRVLRGVVIRRIVATQRRVARLTCPQMDPSRADLYALFALPALRLFYFLNRPYVRAGFLSHYLLPRFVRQRMAFLIDPASADL